MKKYAIFCCVGFVIFPLLLSVYATDPTTTVVSTFYQNGHEVQTTTFITNTEDRGATASYFSWKTDLSVQSKNKHLHDFFNPSEISDFEYIFPPSFKDESTDGFINRLIAFIDDNPAVANQQAAPLTNFDTFVVLRRDGNKERILLSMKTGSRMVGLSFSQGYMFFDSGSPLVQDKSH